MRENRDELGTCGIVAVTGGSGFVGHHLVNALLDLGKRVIVIDLVVPDGNGGRTGLEFRAVDLCDHEATNRALDGVEVVFHLAGNGNGTVSIMNPLRTSRRTPSPPSTSPSPRSHTM